jgi:RNA polymerase sigma-70 factor (ECF subfamily)
MADAMPAGPIVAAQMGQPAGRPIAVSTVSTPAWVRVRRVAGATRLFRSGDRQYSMQVVPGAISVPAPSRLRPGGGGVGPVRRPTTVEEILATLRAAFARVSGRSAPRERVDRAIAVDVTLESLVIDHGEAAYRVALSVTRDHDLAEDVTQDAMLKAWGALPTWRGDAPLRNWILRITHNTAISALRKRREVLSDPVEMPEQASTTSVERDVHERMALAAFESALDELDELTRSIVVLREVESLSYEEIAEALQVALPTVKTRLLRGRRHLANALGGWEP